VTDVQDPDGQGRVRVRLPWVSDPDGQLYETWARLATPMAGAGRGVWLIPEPDDEVIVGFVGGDRSQPIVLGATWNGRDSPPETMDADNNIRSITSRSGIRLTFDDTDGAVSVTVETPGGQVITCTDSPATIELRDSGGNIVGPPQRAGQHRRVLGLVGDDELRHDERERPAQRQQLPQHAVGDRRELHARRREYLVKP
jgi:uncharacterized protein involved in type VI secretion and phage assembly